LFGADLRQRLQVSQLHRGWNARKDLSGVDQGLRGLKLGFRMDDLGAAVAFRLRLLGDGAHHVFGELHGSDFDVGDFDPPGFGLGIEDALDVGAELFALGQHLVELMLS